MFEIRPHKIQFKLKIGGGEDENGFPIPVKDLWTDPVSCHYNTHGRQLIYKYPDGSTVVYDYMILLDPVDLVRPGTFVRLIDQYGNIQESEKVVQKCVNGQLATKLYL